MKKRLSTVVMAVFSLLVAASLACAVEMKPAAAVPVVDPAKVAADKAKATKDSAAKTKADAKAAVSEKKAVAAGAAADTKAKAGTTKAAAKNALIDINTAGEAELKSIPGVGDTYASKIVAGRPYSKKTDLKTRSIVPANVYEQISPLIIAKRVKK